MTNQSKLTRITMTGENGAEHDIAPMVFDTKKIQEMESDLIRLCEAVGRSFTGSVRCATAAFEEFNKAVIFSIHGKGLEAQYRQEKGKIPGSMRTKRLRKKRRDALLDFAYGGQ